MYQVGINKGIILRCTAYQISSIYFMLVMEHIGTNKVKLVAIQARTVNLYEDVLDECICFMLVGYLLPRNHLSCYIRKLVFNPKR